MGTCASGVGEREEKIFHGSSGTSANSLDPGDSGSERNRFRLGVNWSWGVTDRAGEILSKTKKTSGRWDELCSTRRNRAPDRNGNLSGWKGYHSGI